MLIKNRCNDGVSETWSNLLESFSEAIIILQNTYKNTYYEVLFRDEDTLETFI